jgi:actin-related protein 5
LDSWRGAAKWANNNPFSSQAQFYQTKQQYEEFGSDYTMEHGLMNPYSYNTNN